MWLWLMCVITHTIAQRAPPKAHEQQVEKIDADLEGLRKEIEELTKDLKQLRNDVC